MDSSPFLESGWVIQLHTFAAIEALFLGAIQFFLPKGTAIHKLLGRIWVATIAIVAITSFFIHTIKLVGPFSPIHLLSILTLYTLVESIVAIRAGNVRKHKRGMIIVYALGLVLAGLFTLTPGRVLYRVFIGG